MVIKAWSRLLRLPNLVMITFIQLFIYFCFIHPILDSEEGILGPFESLFVLITLLCISASGYVINNIYDEQIDALDSKKSIIPNKISRLMAWQVYWFLICIGFILALYISYQSKLYLYFWIYPSSVFALWFYSYKLKCFPLLGNLLVSFFTAAVVALIPFIYWENLQDLRLYDYKNWADIMYRLVMLVLFAFMTNLSREIIKDIEDIESDKLNNCKSTANYFGIKNSQFMAINIWLAILIIIASVLFFLTAIQQIILFVIMIGLPSIYLFVLLIKAKNKNDFSKLSSHLKWFMSIGSIYWCLSV